MKQEKTHSRLNFAKGDTIRSSMLPHAIRDPKKAEKETEEKCSSHDTRCLSNGSNQTKDVVNYSQMREDLEINPGNK